MQVDEKSNFHNKLEVGDTVFAVDGQEFKSSEEFMNYVKSKDVGTEVTIEFIRQGKKLTETGKLIELEADKKAGIGIGLVDHTELSTDRDIAIDAGAIGGPSAGLMFTLQTYALLTQQDLRHGKEIAGTGTISFDGTVGPIGGIDKKVIAADREGAEIFFAPDYEITEEMKAEHYEYERNIAFMNQQLNGEIESVFLLADEKYSNISSSMIKEIAKFDGDVSNFLPETINRALVSKYKNLG